MIIRLQRSQQNCQQYDGRFYIDIFRFTDKISEEKKNTCPFSIKKSLDYDS
jgi:hypothetical protein